VLFSGQSQMRTEFFLTGFLALFVIALPKRQTTSEVAELAQAVSQWHDDTATVSAFFKRSKMATNERLSFLHPMPLDTKLVSLTLKKLLISFLVRVM
jgi:hypothetical protein